MSARLEWDNSITGSKLDDAIEAALVRGALVIKDAAVERTPEETGALKDSADVDVDGNEASVYYGEYYAPFVHEKLNHRHPRGGRAKFLESALESEAGRAVEVMAATMQRVLGDG